VTAQTKSAAAREWGENWTLVLTTFVGFSFLAVATGSFSMFMEPISEEFGWSRSFISLGVTISSLVTALLSPFFGVAVDRWGSRRLALPGTVLTIMAICGFSLASGSEVQWLAIWGIYALISITVKTTVWTAPVANTFTVARGLALGITLCGTAVSQTLLPPLTNWLIDSFGWRTAYVYLALGWGGFTFILCWLFLYDTHDRLPAKNRAQSRRDAPVLPGLTIAAAWRDRALWQLAISTLLIMMFTLGLTIHQIAILGEAGVSRVNAAWLSSLAGIAGIAGKLVTGALLDRFRANWVGGLTMSATAFAFFLLIDGVHAPALIFCAMLVNGYTQGTKLQITSYLTSRYAGMRNFGAVFGFMNSVIAIGAATGPLIAGLAYDLSGSYTPFLIAGTIGSIIAGLLLITLPRYPDWPSLEPVVAEAQARPPAPALA